MGAVGNTQYKDSGYIVTAISDSNFNDIVANFIVTFLFHHNIALVNLELYNDVVPQHPEFLCSYIEQCV